MPPARCAHAILCEVPTDGCKHCLISFSTIGSLRMFPCLSPMCVFVIESMSHRTQGPWEATTGHTHKGSHVAKIKTQSFVVLGDVVPHTSWTSLDVTMVCFLRQMPAQCFVCFLASRPIPCSTHPCTSLAEVLAMIPQGLLSSARLVWAQASAVALPGVTSLWPLPPIVFPLQPCLCQALACTRCVGTHGKL